MDSCSEIPEHARILDLPKPTPRLEEETAEILLKDINALCQQLNALSDRPTPDLKALKGVKYSLNAVISLANGSRALPKKDVFHPNSNTWAEMAKRMGVGKAPKRKPVPTGGNTSTECIGPVKGKHAHKYTDPYAAGERSGKHAKPDAVSAAANEYAHASVPALLPLVHSSAHAPPSAVAAGFTAHSFTHSDRSTTGPHVDPASGAVLGLAFASFPTAPSRYTFVPHSAAAPGSAHAGTSAWASFWAEITPGNALVHAHSSQGHST